LITIEGPDLSGKSSAIELIKNFLTEKAKEAEIEIVVEQTNALDERNIFGQITRKLLKDEEILIQHNNDENSGTVQLINNKNTPRWALQLYMVLCRLYNDTYWNHKDSLVIIDRGNLSTILYGELDGYRDLVLQTSVLEQPSDYLIILNAPACVLIENFTKRIDKKKEIYDNEIEDVLKNSQMYHNALPKISKTEFGIYYTTGMAFVKLANKDFYYLNYPVESASHYFRKRDEDLLKICEQIWSDYETKHFKSQ